MLNQIKQLSPLVLLLLCLFSCQSIGKKNQVTIQSKSVDVHQMSQNDKFGDKKSESLTQNTPLSKTDHFPMFYTFMVNHKVRAMEAKPFQNYHLSAEDTTLMNFLKTGERKMVANVLIDENGKVVLAQAASPNQMALLMRQLKVVSKVIMP